MDDPNGVLRDRAAGAALSSLAGKRDEWPDEVAEAVRLVVLAQVGSVQENVDHAMAIIQRGLDDLDYQVLMAGLRKLLVAGLTAKDSADMFLRWYGPEAVGL